MKKHSALEIIKYSELLKVLGDVRISELFDDSDVSFEIAVTMKILERCVQHGRHPLEVKYLERDLLKMQSKLATYVEDEILGAAIEAARLYQGESVFDPSEILDWAKDAIKRRKQELSKKRKKVEQ
jgi:hypothetical protein